MARRVCNFSRTPRGRPATALPPGASDAFPEEEEASPEEAAPEPDCASPSASLKSPPPLPLPPVPAFGLALAPLLSALLPEAPAEAPPVELESARAADSLCDCDDDRSEEDQEDSPEFWSSAKRSVSTVSTVGLALASTSTLMSD